MEMIIIIAIIFFVMMFLGGGLPFPMSADGNVAQQLKSNQYHCEEVVWTASPIVIDSEFNGTMEIACEFEGLSGGGMIELRKHMVQALPSTAHKVHGGPFVESLEGLPSNRYDLSVKFENDRGATIVRGDTQIATDGFTHLRNVFSSTSIPTSGDGKYLKYTRSEVNVTTTDRPGWYRLRLINTNRIEKPWFVSMETFRNTLVDKSVEKFEEKALRILNDVSNHL